MPTTVVDGFWTLPIPLGREAVAQILRVMRRHTGCRGAVIGPLPGHPAVDPGAGGYRIEVIGDYCNMVVEQTVIVHGVPRERVVTIKDKT